MQTLQLTYTENIATQTLALILVNTGLKGDGKTYWNRDSDEIVSENLIYNDAVERVETARQTFEMLAFDKVQVHVNLKKLQVITVLNQAQEMADTFKSVDGKVMHISVMYVGFWEGTYGPYFRDHCYNPMIKGYNYRQTFALTTKGEPIALQEYCYRLSRNPHVHVSLFYDCQNVTSNKRYAMLTAGHIDPGEKGKEGFMDQLDFIDKKDSQRF